MLLLPRCEVLFKGFACREIYNTYKNGRILLINEQTAKRFTAICAGTS